MGNLDGTPPSMTHPAERAIHEIERLPLRNTPSIRAVRRRLSRQLRDAPAAEVRRTASALIDAGYRWVGYELLQEHAAAFASLKIRDIEALGRGMTSWDAVDTFSVSIAGPAWQAGQLSDAAIRRWTGSRDRWWRRAALVATTAFNVPARGGQGDTARTLAICERLAADPDDMIQKGLSWALRELIRWDPDAVADFVDTQEAVLGARVKREVRNKLATGLKNP